MNDSLNNYTRNFDFFSQLGQDLWVMLQTNFKRNGFFVEIGAGNGIELSNTYALEKHLSWQGICVEPCNQVDQLKRNRACIVDTSCVWGESGIEVEYQPRGLFGGIIPNRLRAKTKETLTLRTVSLNDLLERYGAPRYIDYLSIDTEGAEFQIISNFDLGKYEISLMSIEHNGRRQLISEFLTTYGYSRFNHIAFTQDYYKEIVFKGRADLDQRHYPNSITGGDYDDWYIRT